jgi:methionine-gamma-lyase
MANLERRPGFSTRAIHARRDSPAIASQSIAVPIHQTASFAFDDNDDIATALNDPSQGFSYSRLSNPTVAVLEVAIADLENAEAGAAFASGMAAIHATVTTLCRGGDHVVAPASLYGGTFALLQNLLPRFGIQTTFVKNGDLAGFREAMRPTTKVVYAETIGNPALYVADIPALSEIAHARSAHLVVDSTFASPYLCRPLELGADLVLHSASKYLGGHGDLIAGLVVGPEGLVRKIHHTSIDSGGTMAPFVAWLVLRGLKTLALRMERHASNAARIAEVLSKHPRIRRALYPGLPSHPDHEVAARVLPRGKGGMVAFEIDGSREDGARFMNRLRLIQRAGSLGDVHSLAIQPASTTHRQLTPDQLRAAGISEGFIRMSVGIEDVEDLLDDLNQALS